MCCSRGTKLYTSNFSGSVIKCVLVNRSRRFLGSRVGETLFHSSSFLQSPKFWCTNSKESILNWRLSTKKSFGHERTRREACKIPSQEQHNHGRRRTLTLRGNFWCNTWHAQYTSKDELRVDQLRPIACFVLGGNRQKQLERPFVCPNLSNRQFKTNFFYYERLLFQSKSLRYDASSLVLLVSMLPMFPNIFFLSHFSCGTFFVAVSRRPHQNFRLARWLLFPSWIQRRFIWLMTWIGMPFWSTWNSYYNCSHPLTLAFREKRMMRVKWWWGLVSIIIASTRKARMLVIICRCSKVWGGQRTFPVSSLSLIVRPTLSSTVDKDPELWKRKRKSSWKPFVISLLRSYLWLSRSS